MLLQKVTSGVSVHKRMEPNSKLLYSLSFHHRERRFIGLQCGKLLPKFHQKVAKIASFSPLLWQRSKRTVPL
jgi:hypothetical protein